MVDPTIRSQWSIASPNTAIQPLLTSDECYSALVEYFQSSSPFLLAVATESSSHPTGLDSLYAQPWVYAGGGLGNMDECPMQVCLAGGTGRDSLTFASVCIVPECEASDLLSEDFVGWLETAAFDVSNQQEPNSNTFDVVQEYVTLHTRIAQVNKFLGTGWVCGEYKVEWEVIPSILYIGALFSMIFLSFYTTFFKKRHSYQNGGIDLDNTEPHYIPDILNDDAEEKKDSSVTYIVPERYYKIERIKELSWFWSAWDMSEHWKTLGTHRSDTACLDGLKVGSILWVIAGHAMAIQSSAGPGYLNPKRFLPPHGITSTLLGQLLFSSRFAVDTFLCVSGYLVIHILKRKLRHRPKLSEVGLILAYRVLRILPLYAMCVGFWVLLAPHLGSGPFWYKWESFLEPCRNSWWTNLLFVNNFLPWGSPTTDTCFYHSWYLAVDVQLFFFFGPWLAILYNKSRTCALAVTIAIWTASVVLTAYLTYDNKWSINTFDGAAVALFDIEGYAKPHIRAQSYLSGILVAMWPRTRPNQILDVIMITFSLVGIAAVAFITVTGAYARRACNFSEWPTLNDCGSTWTEEATFLYTAFSRAVWSISIAVIMHLCLQQRGGLVGKILSWKVWTSLAHLSFGAYLIHPMVIFVLELGGREKRTFDVFSFLMDFTSIAVASFVLAAAAALVVEFPMNALLRPQSSSDKRKNEKNIGIPNIETIPFYKFQSYGSTSELNN